MEQSLENKDLVIYDKETREIFAIIPYAVDREGVFKEDFDCLVVDTDTEYIVGDGKNIYLSEDVELIEGGK